MLVAGKLNSTWLAHVLLWWMIYTKKNCQVEKVVNFGFLKRWLSDFSCDFPTSRECQAHMHACCKPIASKINPSFIARLLWPKLGSTMRWWRISTLQMTMFMPAVHLIQKSWWYIVVYKLINLYIYIYIYIYLYISVYISIYLYVFVYLSAVCIYRSIYLSSIYIYLSVYLSIYLSISLSFSLSLSLVVEVSKQRYGLACRTGPWPKEMCTGA